MRGISQSALEYSLSLGKKNTVKKILTPPKLGPKKTVSVIAFQIAMTIDVKSLRFGHQVAVCVKKWHKKGNFLV